MRVCGASADRLREGGGVAIAICGIIAWVNDLAG
jgi:hypothetical protein